MKIKDSDLRKSFKRTIASKGIDLWIKNPVLHSIVLKCHGFSLTHTLEYRKQTHTFSCISIYDNEN